MKHWTSRAAIKIESQFLAIVSEPTQVPAAATFCGAIGSGWPGVAPGLTHRALVDRWLERHQLHGAVEHGQV